MNVRTRIVGLALTVAVATAKLESAGAQEGSTPAAQRGEVAESILAAKERALGEPFGASIRAHLKSRMETLSLEQLKALAQQASGADIPLILGSVTSDLVYTPVTPCRVFDSRVSQGGPGPIPANTQRNVFVAGTVGFPAQGGLSGGCGVPIGATSAIINFATVLPAGPGNIRAWAVADPQPAAPLAAVMNYGAVAGLPAIANGVPVPLCNPAATLCTLGDLRLQADTSGTDILGDVVGYFGPAVGAVQRDRRGQRDRLEPPERRDQRVQPERRAPWDRQDPLAPRDQRAQPDRKGSRDRLGPPGRQDQQAQPAHRAPPVPRPLPASRSSLPPGLLPTVALSCM